MLLYSHLSYCHLLRQKTRAPNDGNVTLPISFDTLVKRACFIFSLIAHRSFLSYLTLNSFLKNKCKAFSLRMEIVSKETVVLRRWEIDKQELGL